MSGTSVMPSFFSHGYGMRGTEENMDRGIGFPSERRAEIGMEELQKDERSWENGSTAGTREAYFFCHYLLRCLKDVM